MKAARLLLIGSGVIVVLLIIALMVAFNSSFQTWAARRVLRQQPGVTGTVEHVSAGLGRIEIRNLTIRTHGAVLTLPSVETELPLISAAMSQRVLVSRLVAKGWTLDLSQASNLTALMPQATGTTPVQLAQPLPGFSLLSSAYAAEALPAAAAATVFRGVVDELRLPVDVSLDGLELDGEVILPPMGGHGSARAKISLRGGGLAAGREGVFLLELSGAKPDGGSLALHARLVAAMDTPRTFKRIGAKADATVTGPQFPNGVKLSIDTAAERTASGENYSLLVSGSDKQLAAVKAALLSAESRITGTWTLDLHDRDLTPFAFGRHLPTFAALGEGTFETGTDFNEVHATGQLKASADRLDVLRPELAAVGEMNFTADFDLLQHGTSLRVEKFNATLSGAAPVASVHALQPFEFNLGTAELRVADPAKDLVGLSLTGLPLAWTRPLIGDLVVTGGDVRGEFAASARDGGLALRARTPLTLSAVSLTQAGKPLLRDVDVTLNASADYTPQGWQAHVVEFSLHQRGATLLVLDAKAGQLAGKDRSIKATGRWSADLPGWLTQPVIAGQLQLVSGAAQGDFSASLDGTCSLEAKIDVANLVASTKEKLPAVSARLQADVGHDGRITFKAPLVFTQAGRVSDLLFAGTYAPGPTSSAIDARLSGDLVIVEDVKLLGLLVPAVEAPSAQPDGTTPPAWAAFNGQIGLALKKVVYGGNYVVTDVAGTLRLDPSSIKLEGVRALFSPESDLKLNGGVTYDPKAKQAYSINADVALNNFDTGAAFRAIDPAKLPSLEAKVNVTGHIAGDGANLGEATDRARGHFDVSSKGGVFRMLQTVLPNDRAQAAQSALSIVGGFLGGSAGESVNAVNEIVKSVSEIQFDQLSVKAERSTDLNLMLHDFTLIAPNIRLGGAGQVTYKPDTSLLQQALDLRITLGARGRLGDLLGQVKMLKAEKDSLGYTAMSAPIKIGGTLSQTDTSDLKAKLLDVAIEKSGIGDALNRLRGGGK